jgi:phosphoglycolate phosphatase-like HAD superfamily hydrolase
VRFIIDLDGPVLGVEPQYFRAYCDTAAALGHQPTPPRKTFWRVIREGLQFDRLISGAKPDEIRQFRAAFQEALESDEALGECVAQPETAAALERLKRAGSLVLVTLGTNRGARQRLLDSLDLAVHFMTMRCLSAEPAVRVAQLRELAEGDRRVVVACASEPLARAAHDAGMLPVAIASGAAVDGRLTRAGAQLVYPHLEALADEVESGGERLVHAGLLPPEHALQGNPFLEPEWASDRDRSRYRTGRRR